MPEEFDEVRFNNGLFKLLLTWMNPKILAC
jgi:hypothetical protein